MSSNVQTVTPFERFREAYQRMAREANYRPAAPGDGLGSIHLTEEQARDPALLAEEASRYARHFLAEEDAGSFLIGCSDYGTNRAFLFTIEAARLLCAKLEPSARIAATLLQMACAEIESVEPARRGAAGLDGQDAG